MLQLWALLRSKVVISVGLFETGLARQPGALRNPSPEEATPLRLAQPSGFELLRSSLNVFKFLPQSQLYAAIALNAQRAPLFDPDGTGRLKL
ncbi:MAG: hypothetical protein RML93_07415 [Anaerolineales bacterium]|nr:hypothetical protein [Anaerolineales bacterium]MDW8447101.1 hypothetical protein [Anaerolineales bacterium]